jgi:ABC-type transport system involved in multi-copper enzyme maturation permease subunit
VQAEILDAGEGPIEGEPSRWARAWRPVEDWLIALVDRANPILVKETRQALKSRQFVITFLVVLVACWMVSFIGIAWVGPEIYWAAAGPTLLMGYYVVLAIPLALIVPFSAFRSLAAEQEEQTYELLSITTLSSRKIITGKLLSAAVQMIVYLCAVSPCVAFTFLLRGVDAMTIAVVLAGMVLGSMGLSMIALLIGAMARLRGTQVVTSVILILGLALACVGGIALGWMIIQAGSGFMREEGFWIAISAMLTFYITFFGLFHSAAAAQIAFVSENRSTPLRRWMTVQQACFCGWMAAAVYSEISSSNGNRANSIGEMLVAATVLATGYWAVMGALLTGEWPHLSRRVQRSLPQSTLGRTTLSLFNPGPGTGYLFAVSNLTTLIVVGLIVLLFRGPATGRFVATETIACLLVLSWSYVVGYLDSGGLSRCCCGAGFSCR